MIIFGIGLGIVMIGCIIAADQPRWSAFAIGAVIGTILASIWTFQFSLALQIQFSNATSQATAELAALQRSPLNQGGIPTCTVHATGNVGPLSAPYRECAFSYHVVTFNPVGNRATGLIYVDNLARGSVVVPDTCVRPLMGGWSMFTTDGTTCPSGYKFIGGP